MITDDEPVLKSTIKFDIPTSFTLIVYHCCAVADQETVKFWLVILVTITLSGFVQVAGLQVFRQDGPWLAICPLIVDFDVVDHVVLLMLIDGARIKLELLASCTPLNE